MGRPNVGDLHLIPNRKVFGEHAGHSVEVLEVNDLEDGSAEVLRRCSIDGKEWRVGWWPSGAPDDD